MPAVFAADRLRCHRTLEECPALNACRPTVLAGLSDLGRVDAHMRVGDVVSVKWSSWDGESLVWQQSKTGHLVQVRAPMPLRDELDHAPRRAEQILANIEGKPYTRDGLQTLLCQPTKRLEYLGLVKRRLCCHGLRHSSDAIDAPRQSGLGRAFRQCESAGESGSGI